MPSFAISKFTVLLEPLWVPAEFLLLSTGPLLYIIVFEIKRPDSAIQKIHFDIPPLHKKPDKEQTFQSAPYPAVVSLEQRALRANRKRYSIVNSASQ